MSCPLVYTYRRRFDLMDQESVCTALLVSELLKRFFSLTGPGPVLGPNESLPQCHFVACQWLQRLLPEAELRPSAFPS